MRDIAYHQTISQLITPIFQVYLDALSKELESLKRMHEDTQRRIVSIAARVAEETERHERWIRAMSERRAAESKYGKLEEEKASLIVATSRINSLIRAISTSNRSSDSAAGTSI